jgi:hypothetical protein
MNFTSHDALTELVDFLILKKNTKEQHAVQKYRMEVQFHNFTSALSRLLLR